MEVLDRMPLNLRLTVGVSRVTLEKCRIESVGEILKCQPCHKTYVEVPRATRTASGRALDVVEIPRGARWACDDITASRVAPSGTSLGTCQGVIRTLVSWRARRAGGGPNGPTVCASRASRLGSSPCCRNIVSGSGACTYCSIVAWGCKSMLDWALERATKESYLWNRSLPYTDNTSQKNCRIPEYNPTRPVDRVGRSRSHYRRLILRRWRLRRRKRNRRMIFWST